MNTWREQLTKEEHRPAIAAIVTSVGFCVWNVVFDPRFYVGKLANRFSFSGDSVVDAELFRAAGNVLLVATLVATIKFTFRQSLADYGLGLGNWSRERLLLLATTPLMLLMGYVGAQKAEYQAHYPETPGLAESSISVFVLHVTVLVTFYIAWELLFRGFLQSAFLQLGGAGAIAVQTLASSIAHADRPDSEMLGSILIGVFWGYLAYRTRSIWPVVMQHFLLGLSLDYFLCFG